MFVSVSRVALVTGGNKGIGLEICRQLASNDIKVILTARNESRGIEAIEKLKVSGPLDVVFHQLDVKDPSSIARLAKYVELQFKKLDILVRFYFAKLINNDLHTVLNRLYIVIYHLQDT